MKALIQRLVLVGLSAGLGACAARQAPPVKHYALGMARADYRDYAGAKATPCDAEPRWLADELTAVNGLLARFLRETEKVGQPEAPEHEQHVALLQEAVKTLPPVLGVHRGTLAGLEQCGFRRSGAFPEISRRGVELLEATKVRLAEGSKVAAALETRKKWEEEAPQREAAARQTWCPAKPQVGSPDLYYARREADGRTLWRFCDGHVVEQAPGGEPQLREPEGLTRPERRRVQPQRYLEASQNYPAEEIDRAPGTAAKPS